MRSLNRKVMSIVMSIVLAVGIMPLPAFASPSGSPLHGADLMTAGGDDLPEADDDSSYEDASDDEENTEDEDEDEVEEEGSEDGDENEEDSGEITREGTWGSCAWHLSDEGTLELSSGEGADTQGESPWEGIADHVMEVRIVGSVKLPQDVSFLFAGLSEASAIEGMDNLDWSGGILDTSSMFADCSSLTEIDLSKINIAEVICPDESGGTIAPYRTSSSKDMFSECSSLTRIVMGSGWRLIDNGPHTVGSYDDGSVKTATFPTTMQADGVQYKKNVAIPWGAATYERYVPDYAEDPEYSGTWGTCDWFITAGVLYIDEGAGEGQYDDDPSPWEDYADEIKRIKVVGNVTLDDSVSGIGSANSASYAHLFAGLTSLEEVNGREDGFANFKTTTFWGSTNAQWSTVTSVAGLFEGCTSLRTADLSGFPLPGCRDLSNLFAGCSALEQVDISALETERSVYDEHYSSIPGLPLRDMRGMFAGCSALGRIVTGKHWSQPTGGYDEGAGDAVDWCATFPTAMSSADGSGYHAGDKIPDGAETYFSETPGSSETGEAIDLSGKATVSATSQQYDGTEKTPEVMVELNGQTLTVGEDYEVSYWIAADDSEGEDDPDDESDDEGDDESDEDSDDEDDDSGEDADEPDENEADDPESEDDPDDGKGEESDQDSEESEDDPDEAADPDIDGYERAWELVHPDVYLVAISGIGRYTGVAYGTFTITYSLENARADGLDGEYEYDLGNALINLPDDLWVEADNDDVSLSYGAHYVIDVYRNGKPANVDGKDFTVTAIGNYQVMVRGIGACVGTGFEAGSFEVVPASIAIADVAAAPSATYDGKTKAPSVRVTASTFDEDDRETVHELRQDVDYTLTYEDEDGKAVRQLKSAGDYMIVITGKGNFTDETYADFTIKPASLSKAAISGVKNKTYTGSPLSQSPTIKVKLGEKQVTLRNRTDYTLSYSKNKNVGTATVTVTGNGNFTGTASAKFTIKKAANPLVAKAKKKSSTVKLSAVRAKARTIANLSVTKAKGAVSFKNASGKAPVKKWNVSSKGVLTVPKGTRKGTYDVKIKVSAAGDKNHASGSKTVAFKVKVA